MSTLKNIIILGGGAFGLATARELVTKLDTTRFKLILITSRPYYVHLPGLIRTVVTAEGALEKQVLMPYANSLKGKGEVKVASVVSFTSTKEGGEVELSTGERLPYSVLVLAPGAIWEGPLNLPEEPAAVLEHINAWRAKIENANSILLVGGGAVGIEFAGEIKDFFPSKSVTLAHGQAKLINDTYPDKYRSKLLARVNKTGTEVVLNEYVDATEPSEDGTVTTRSGKKLKADLIIPSRGGRPNTSVISSSLGADAVTASGHIKVLRTLQLPDHPRIFAAGDAIEWKEQKQAGKSTGHATAIAKNILALLNGGEASTPYKGATEMIVTTVGRTGGVAYMGFLWGITFGDGFSAMVKSKTLLVDMMRNSFELGKLE
ncbi:hypothetical protein D9611_010179 [Ephemerocybe angulata]|uniref:FAD/NAD(P)-binding domain-containing protein n=1 Tax=Ephemerocybe angulata TaxID=980116 RepID=A0A8H5AZM8_9AGAR|nr:hypothetical protein D9611_010179 [Tulosesus angulatus]